VPGHRRQFSPQSKTEAVPMMAPTSMPSPRWPRDCGSMTGPRGTEGTPRGRGASRARQASVPVECARVTESEGEAARLPIEN